MSKVQSGGRLIGIAVLMNIGGRLLLAITRGSHEIVLAGFILILMFSSVIVGLFGLIRLIIGLLSKK